MAKFINLYDDNYTDVIVRTDTIDTIKKIQDNENNRTRVDFLDGKFMILEYDDEDNRDDAFEDFVDDLCDGEDY